jgi:hypothetical protein
LVYTWLYPRKFTQVLQNIEASWWMVWFSIQYRYDM